MKTWLVNEMVARKVCYPRERLVGLFKNRPHLSVLDILQEADAPATDRLWCVWASALPADQYQQFVERVVARWPNLSRLTRWAGLSVGAAVASRQALEGLSVDARTVELNQQISDLIEILTSGD